MKKVLAFLSIATMIVVLVFFCSCGNEGKKTDEITDSLTVVNNEDPNKCTDLIGEKMKVVGRTTELLSDYMYHHGDISKNYLSFKFKEMVEKYNHSSYHEPWSLMWSVGSAVEVVKFAVINISNVKDEGMKVACRLFITEDGESVWPEDFNIYMIQENGEWVAKDFEHGDSAMEMMSENM